MPADKLERRTALSKVLATSDAHTFGPCMLWKYCLNYIFVHGACKEAIQGPFHIIAGSVAANSAANSLKPPARAIRTVAHGLGLGSFRRDRRHARRLLPVAQSRRPRLTCRHPGC